MGDATLADATHVVLKSVKKSYGEIEAIRDASFALTAGEFVSALGPLPLRQEHAADDDRGPDG